MSDSFAEKTTAIQPTQHREYAPSLAGSAQDEDIEPEMHFRTWLVVLAAAMSYMAIVWTLGAIGLQKASIVASIGGSNQSIWIQNSGTLVSIVLGPPLSRIGDQVGRKWICVVCGLLGVVGAGLIGGSTTMGMAIAGGVLCGAQQAMQGPLSAIASEVLPRRQRGLAQGFLNWGPSMGGIFAATAGQKISSYVVFGGVEGWRAGFYFAAGVTAAATLLMVVSYNPPPVPNPENRTYAQRWLDFDKFGTFLLLLAITPLSMGLTWGGGAYPWKSAAAIAPTVIGALLLIVLGVYEWQFKKNGLFHHGQFVHINFPLTLTANFVEIIYGIFYFVYNAYYGAQASLLYDSSPLGFGLIFSYFYYPGLLLYPSLGYVVRRTRNAKTPLVIGYVIFVAVMIGLAQTGVGEASKKGFIVGGVMAGVAFVPAECLLQMTAQLAVPPELIGTAAALGSSVRSFGGLIGVAIATSIFNSKVAINVPKYVAPAALGAGVPATDLPAFIGALAAGDIAGLQTITGITPAMIEAGAAALQQAFAQSLKYIFMVLALVAVLLLKSIKTQMNWIVNRPVEAIHHRHGHHEAKTDPVVDTVA